MPMASFSNGGVESPLCLLHGQRDQRRALLARWMFSISYAAGTRACAVSTPKAAIVRLAGGLASAELLVEHPPALSLTCRYCASATRLHRATKPQPLASAAHRGAAAIPQAVGEAASQLYEAYQLQTSTKPKTKDISLMFTRVS